MEIPRFNFKTTLTEEEVKKTEEESGKKEQKVFQPGTYDLKIVSAEYHQPMNGDPTWHGYKIKLGLDSRTIGCYTAVPTQGPLYNKPGMDPKAKTFMFHKFRDFVRGLGEDPSVDALNKTINKLFKDPSVLVGRSMKVDIAYKGPHPKYIEKGVLKLVDKDGKELIPQTFSDRDSVTAHAAMLGLIVTPFPEVVKIHPQVQKQETKETDPWGE